MHQKVDLLSISLKVFLFLSICFTYGATYRGPLYNLIFLATLILGIDMLFKTILTLRISKKFLYLLLVSILPFIVNGIIILNTEIINRERHNSFLGLTLILTVASVLLVELLFRKKSEIKYVFLVSSIIWVTVNTSNFILNKFNIIHSYSGSFSGIFINRNDFAVSSVVMLALLYIVLDSFGSKKVQMIAKITIFMLIGLILLSLSMKGVFGVIFIISSYRLLLSSNSIGNKILYIYFGLALVTLLYGLGSLLNSALFIRINLYVSSIFGDLDTYQNSNERISLINQAIEVIKNNMFSGVGMDNSRYYLYVTYASGREVGKYSHNNFLEIMLNGGLFTFIFYYYYLVKIFIISLFNLKKKKVYGYIIMLLSLKLFFDGASVTYTNSSVIFLYTFSVYLYIKYRKGEDINFV